jgi:NAD(P)H-hydrate epimerase
MKPVITPEESARLDATATDPVETLMERAGLAVALAAVAEGASYGSRVVVLAGPGNNGGDGYVAARYLAQRGVAVEVHALAPPQAPAASWAQRTAVEAGVRVRDFGDPVQADLVIDALFGAGFRGGLPEQPAVWTTVDAPVVAVDIPSGLDSTTGQSAGPVFVADRTVTFHALKVGHLIGRGPDLCGRVEVADIGLVGGEGEFLLCEERDALRPPRDLHAHKWSSGSVVVVGGSAGLTGAAYLAARSALQGGAGAVTIACPAALQPIYAGMTAEIMTAGIGTGARFAAADVPAVLQAAARYDILALGPGLGAGQESFVAGLMEGWEGPLVIDADGINAIADPDALARRTVPTVITPHGGEFRRLTGREATYQGARELAGSTDTVVLLKGAPTFVAGRQLWAVTSGGKELATIGTGDVLTGLASALWARGLDPESAARSAAYWHGVAGAAAAANGTLTAETLADEIGRFAW